MEHQIHISKNNGLPEVSFGDLDKINAINVKSLENKLKNLLHTSETGIALNLENIKIVDSQGFSMILNLVKEAKRTNKSVFFSKTHSEICELIQMLGISDSMLNIEEYI